ncbi:MAG: FGGY-family carbohydrate kinase, partial [Christensenella sp.]
DMLKNLGIVTDTVLSLGGGSRSPIWMQIKADICKKTLYSAQCSEAASEGAALLALWGAGILAYGERPMKNGRETAYIPNLQNGEIYDKSYSLYKNLYSAVKPLF